MLYQFDHQELKDFPYSARGEASDEQLMLRIQNRDDAALEMLYLRHVTFLRSIASGVINNDHDVDEVIQEVFLKIWQRAEHYNPEKGKALGWIVTLARRRAIDKVRKTLAYNRARERSQLAGEDGLSLSGYRNRRETVASEMSEVFDVAMATLPVAQREAIHFAFYRGLSQREIAAQTGIPLGTIKTRIELALRKLREAILALDGPADWCLAAA